jgi:hypothetical protein
LEENRRKREREKEAICERKSKKYKNKKPNRKYKGEIFLNKENICKKRTKIEIIYEDL